MMPPPLQPCPSFPEVPRALLLVYHCSELGHVTKPAPITGKEKEEEHYSFLSNTMISLSVGTLIREQHQGLCSERGGGANVSRPPKVATSQHVHSVDLNPTWGLGTKVLKVSHPFKGPGASQL